MSPIGRKLRTARRRLGVLRTLSHLPEDDLHALRMLAGWAAEERLVPARSPHIDPTALISPLASLRFAERVSIGHRAVVGPFCAIWGGWTTTWARVGAGAALSPGVVMVAGNHRFDEPVPLRDSGFDEADVEIGEGAWVGAHAVIVGCRVGAGAVVGANAVVLEDVPDGAIAIGVPARVVGQRPSGATRPADYSR